MPGFLAQDHGIGLYALIGKALVFTLINAVSVIKT